MSEMTSRERIVCAAGRGVPDRVPRDFLFEGRVAAAFRNYLGVDNLDQAIKQDVIDLGPGPTRKRTDFSRYYSNDAVTWDEWGRGRIWDSQQHYAEYLYPLQNAESEAEIDEYPWPDLTETYRFEGMKDKVDRLHDQGLAVRAELSETTFEIAWQMRSMDRLFDDMAHDEGKAALVLDKITERRIPGARAFALAGADILYLGDDVAMQTGLMMSRKMWRKWLMPRLKQVIDAAREINPKIPVQYHSDGKINALIPDLIEAGVTILNPVQPECVDHVWVKSEYGDQLAFCGGLGVQSVLPLGTPDEVYQHTVHVLKTLGDGGGLIVGPSHVIERDTPMENIMALLAAIEAEGKYS